MAKRKSDRQLIRENDYNIRYVYENGNSNLGSTPFLIMPGFRTVYYWKENCVVTRNEATGERKVVRGIFTREMANKASDRLYEEFKKNKQKINKRKGLRRA